MSGMPSGDHDMGLEAATLKTEAQAALERPEIYMEHTEKLLGSIGSLFVETSNASTEKDLPDNFRGIYAAAANKMEGVLTSMGFAMQEGATGLSTDILDATNTSEQKQEELDAYLISIDPASPHHRFMQAHLRDRVRIDYDPFITFAEGANASYSIAQGLAQELRELGQRDTLIDATVNSIATELTFLGTYVDVASARNDETEAAFITFRETSPASTSDRTLKEYLDVSAYSRGQSGFN